MKNYSYNKMQLVSKILARAFNKQKVRVLFNKNNDTKLISNDQMYLQQML